MMDWFWIGVGAICGAIAYMFVDELRKKIKDLEMRIDLLEKHERGKE